MDAFKHIFGALGNFFGSRGGQVASGLGLGIPAIIGQIQKGKQQNAYINSILGMMKNYQNPAWVGNQLNSLVRPLDASLVQSVQNPVQAFLGERGLSEAPGLANIAMTQALAPYAQQNIQTAASLLGLPIQAGGVGSYAFLPQEQSNLGGIMKLLMGGPGAAIPGQAQQAQPGGYGAPFPTSSQAGIQLPMLPPNPAGVSNPYGGPDWSNILGTGPDFGGSPFDIGQPSSPPFIGGI